MDAQISRRGRLVTVALGGLVCAALLGGVVSPAWAAEPGDGGGSSWPVGGFALGDEVEGLIDERSGALSFVLPAGSLGLSWDARAAAVDRHGFGHGWTVAGAGFVDTEGGVRVFPASGGVFPAVSSVPSGLSGYALEDLRFEQVPGVVPARADGLAGERAYAFRLIELGGTVSYFDAAGDPVMRMDPFGNRTDWSWTGDGSHQLTGVVSDVGVVTSLDWSDPARVEVSTRAGAGPASVTTVELDGGRVTAVVDAGGGRTRVAYTVAGLVRRLEGVSGASTEVAWQQLPDASVAVDRVRVVDPGTGAVLSERAWEPAVGLASGWPAVQDASMGASAAGAAARAGAYSTSVSDGVTRIVSEYSERQVLTGRKVIAGGASGERVLQEQAFEYPGDEGDGLPPQADRPSRVAVTHWNEAGAARTAEEGFVVDELGRVVEQTAADGTVTETHYDLEPGEHGIPVGLPLTERVTTSDGLVSESRYTLNDAGTAVVAAETWTGSTDEPELVRVARTEFDVAGDGFVTAERVFPQGGAGEPTVTLHEKSVDPATGELTLAKTVAAGTELAATTTTVTDLRLGQPVAVTDVVGNTTTTGYDELGRPVRQPGVAEASAVALVGDVTHQPFGYAGEYTNPTGTQHLQVRSYDPETRRFQQFDLADEHNPYWFGNANPVTFVDPTGRSGMPDWGLYVLTGVGLALSVFGLFAAAGAAGAAMAGAGSWAAVLTGTKVTLAATAAAAVVDVGLAGALAVDEFAMNIFNDEVALILGITTAALGVAAGAVAIGNRLAPARNWTEALQKDWSDSKLTGWSLAHGNSGRELHWVGTGRTREGGIEFARFTIVKNGNGDLKVGTPGEQLMPFNGRAFDVISMSDAPLQERKFNIMNPRYGVDAHEPQYLDQGIDWTTLQTLMDKHNVHVFRLSLDQRVFTMDEGFSRPEVWYRDPPSSVAAVSDRVPKNVRAPNKYED
ncbi:RHS repeat-associated core domain-containing protein [Agromyces silvae]|uniref:RHS repeat-associated core domain-containing protein n=1 Tax=Agromyces silvae TaxID=3388266 RepID=UPI00280A7576|nr:RHS repeat-associated core domain-containing protein [Agromyces protaetiae]